MTTKPSNTNMVQTTSVALMMLDFTMIELTIPTRMPRFYEEVQEEKEEEAEGVGVRHWRLFLVVIDCSQSLVSENTTQVEPGISSFQHHCCHQYHATIICSVAGVLLLLCLLRDRANLPTNGLHLWPLRTSSLIASVKINSLQRAY